MRRPSTTTVLHQLERHPDGTTCSRLARELGASYGTTRNRLGELFTTGQIDVATDRGVDIWQPTTILREVLPA